MGGWLGGWVVGFGYIIMPLRGPNLQVRTCKIQTKLDSKLGPSVAIAKLAESVNPSSSSVHSNRTIKNNIRDNNNDNIKDNYIDILQENLKDNLINNIKDNI